MSTRLYAITSVACLVACVESARNDDVPLPDVVSDPMAYADTRLGSGGFAFGAGNTFPGATAVNGLVKVGPDTTGPQFGTALFLHYSGYWDGDDTVQGFSHLHLSGTGAADYGVLSVMPIVSFDPSRLTATANEERLDKSSETARPGFYATRLESGIQAEFTASHHVAHHRYTFPKEGGRFVLFDLGKHLSGGEVTLAEATLDVEKGEVVGMLHHLGGMSRGFGGYDVFFAVRAKQPWTSARVWKEGSGPAEATFVRGREVGFVLGFEGTDPVELQVGVSLVSIDGALGNLRDEAATFDFETLRDETEGSWRKRLAAVTAYGGSEAHRAMLYSALHHLYVMPSITCDTDGKFLYAGKMGHVAGWRFMSELSLWDTYRTLNPLYSLIAPDRALDVVKSLDEMAKMGGFYPLWPIATGESGVMLGASAEVVIADAYLKGIRDFDSEAAWQRMKAAALDATPPAGGRGGRNVGFDFYAREGFVPVSASARSVSHTLEFSQDDFALSQFAAALGHDEEARALLARSQGYRRLWDVESGFLRARAEDGRVKEGPFDPLKWDDHAEANAWQSLFGAPHDIDGLARLVGGREALLARLTEFFERARADEDQRRAHAERHPEDLLTPNVDRPYFWAGNEPDIHAPYLFAMLGRPDLTQHWVAWTRETYYAPTPAGLPGNDDGGTLSAWWIWSALGLYPLVGSDTYVLGTPLFPRLDLAVSGGTFTIATKNGGGGRIYVALVSLDGRPLTKPYLSHAQIKAGSALVFEMSDVPATWGR